MLDPDFEIRWGAGPSPKIFFQPFRLQFGLPNKGGPGPPTPPLDLLLKFITNRGWARIFKRGGGSHCVTPKVFTRLACRHPGRVLLKVMFFFFFRMSSECGGRNKPTRSLHGLIIYAMWNLVIKFQQKLMGGCSTPYVYEFLVPCRVNYSILATKRTWSTADVRSCNWSKDE